MGFSIFARYDDSKIIAAIEKLSVKIDQQTALVRTQIQKETQMAATLTDLDKAIENDSALEANLEAAIAANTNELQALKAAIGTSAPDLQPQVDKILARQAALTSAIQTLQEADTANAPA